MDEAESSLWGFGFIFKRFVTVGSSDDFKSAHLKIDRASFHIAEVSKVLQDRRPFRYILKTDVKTGRRSIGAEENEPVIDSISLICGDAIHNLRSAIDHAYVTVLKPHITDPRMMRTIQFPFSPTAANLKAACHKRYANKVSPEFVAAIMALKPHNEPGGNEFLAFLHYSDIPDKHVHLIPTGHYVDIAAQVVRRYAPDFPAAFRGNIQVSNSRGYDFLWDGPKFNLHEWVVNRTPRNGVFEEEINVPVNVTFRGRIDGRTMFVIPSLYQFVDVAKQVIHVISKFH